MLSRMTRTNISSESEFEDLIGYSRAVRLGNSVAVSGTTAAAPGKRCAASPSRWSRRYAEAAAAHAEVFGTIRPAASMYEVRALITPALLVEIEADAVVTE